MKISNLDYCKSENDEPEFSAYRLSADEKLDKNKVKSS